jgi:hypothetical protein
MLESAALWITFDSIVLRLQEVFCAEPQEIFSRL